MEMTFDYKNVDWKAVKAEWDASPYFFRLVILHNGNCLSFDSVLDKSKRYRLFAYVDGRFEGAWTASDNSHNMYMNKKTIQPSKSLIDFHKAIDRKCRKMTPAQIIKYKEIKIPTYSTPFFSSITQIKKMVTALE